MSSAQLQVQFRREIQFRWKTYNSKKIWFWSHFEWKRKVNQKCSFSRLRVVKGPILRGKEWWSALFPDFLLGRDSIQTEIPMHCKYHVSDLVSFLTDTCSGKWWRCYHKEIQKLESQIHEIQAFSWIKNFINSSMKRWRGGERRMRHKYCRQRGRRSATFPRA